MKISRTMGVLGMIACSAMVAATFAGCADDKTTAGGTCKGDSACCSADKSACCKDASAAKCTEGKTTDTKAKDGMNN